MDLRQRRVAERELDASGVLAFGPLDRTERLPRVGTSAVAELRERASGPELRRPDHARLATASRSAATSGVFAACIGLDS
jgi:hypothetical protein